MHTGQWPPLLDSNRPHFHLPGPDQHEITGSTSDEQLKQLLRSHVGGAQLDGKQRKQLNKISSMEAKLEAVEKQEKVVAAQEGQDQKKLSIVGPDLNFLYGKMSL